MRFLIRFALIAAVTLAAKDDSLKAQTPERPSSVVIALFRDYPAFRPSNRSDTNREVQALVIPTDYADKNRSVIILNPEYATPKVLFAAIARLNSMPARWQQNTVFTITRTTRALEHGLDPTLEAALAQTIQRLSSMAETKLSGHPSAKHIVIPSELQKMVADAQTTSHI